ncbi:MAG: hypothetical protein J0H07_14335 [Sphingobacteriales bacterium]|nr:hypothetical protein [Sphingobacteriales bacterium]
MHLAQAELALDKARNNAYSDRRKEEYQNKLTDLYTAVYQEVNKKTSLTEADIYALYKRHIDFIFKSLEFLDSSTLNQIPYEIIECLNYAMNDWLGSRGDYIIVTSLINDVGGFSFDPSLAYSDALYDEIKAKYGIEFPQRLVQINLPRALARDYLASVVLYHELGHFVDMKFKFTESLTRDILNNVTEGRIAGKDLANLLIYFPYLNSHVGSKKTIPTQSQLFIVTNSHLAEYFCDLFASQYIADSSNYYLQYITENANFFSTSHPSTVNRVQTVTDFLSKSDNIVVKIINTAIYKIKKENLEIRNEAVKSDDFFNLVPTIIENVGQLHGILNTGWRVWLHQQEQLSKSLNDQFDNPLRLYSVVNNLLEKSIGNFITLNKWNKVKP